jgi:hypothetical protein
MPWSKQSNKMKKNKTEQDIRLDLQRRIKYGVTITQLAREFKCPLSTLQQFMRGSTSLSDALAEKLGFEKVFVARKK